MNGVIWGFVALVNSGVFWETRGYVDHKYLTEISVMLAALGILGLSDFLKQRTFIRSKAQQLAVVISNPFRYHYQHLSAFVQIYKMAPQILAERETMLQLGQRMGQLDANLLHLTATTSRTEEVPSMPPKTELSPKVVGKKVRSLPYTIDFGDDPRSVFKALGINSRIRGRKTLVVSDLGEAELTKIDLQNYLDDRIELQYWKSRSEGEKFEVLTIDRVLWADYPELMEATIKKLGSEYELIFVVKRHELKPAHESVVEV